MMTSVPSFGKTILIDSGFWYALYEPRDEHHKSALEKAELLDNFNLVIPWPCLYETFNTRFAKNKTAILSFEQLLKRPNVVLLPDEVYREVALEAAIAFAQTRYFALVDIIADSCGSRSAFLGDCDQDSWGFRSVFLGKAISIPA